MRHFGSLVLALVLAPVIWVAIAFGTNRLARSVLDLAGSADTDKYLGIGLILVAAVALGVLLVPRLSPLGPAIAGVGFLAVSALGLSSGSPVYDLGKDVGLSTADQQTLVSPIPTGYLWLAGFLLLVPLIVPARWRKPRKAAPVAATGPYGPGGAPTMVGQPGSPGPGQPDYGQAGPGRADYGRAGSASQPDYGQPGQPDYGQAGSASQPDYGQPAGGGQPDYGRPDYASYGSGGYNPPGPVGSPVPAETPGTPGWDNPPQYYPGERPAQSPGSAQFPSASPYPGSQGAQYPPSTYGSGGSAPDSYQAQNYPTTYSAPEPTPGPTSYAPTVYGRQRDDDPPPPPPRDNDDDPQETRRLS